MPKRGRCLLEFEVEPQTIGTSHYLQTFHHFYVQLLKESGLKEENEYFRTHALESLEFATQFDTACRFILDISCEKLADAREITNLVYRRHQTAFHFQTEHPEAFTMSVACNCHEEPNNTLVW